MQAYVAEDDNAELTLQRRVEQANKIVKRFKTLGTEYRKGAVHAFKDIQLIASVVVRIVFWDLFLNQEHGGAIHSSGPTPDFVPWNDEDEPSAANRSRHHERNVQALLRGQRRIRKISVTQQKRRISRLKKVGVNLRLVPSQRKTPKSREIVINRVKR